MSTPGVGRKSPSRPLPIESFAKPARQQEIQSQTKIQILMRLPCLRGATGLDLGGFLL